MYHPLHCLPHGGPDTLQFSMYIPKTRAKTSASIMPVKVQPFQDLAKVPSHCCRQVDFPPEQITFHSHLFDGQGMKQIIIQLNH